MPGRDFSKVNKQRLVADHGREITEGPDLTSQIAKSKGHAKRHGRWLTVCPHCGEYLKERDRQQHVEDCVGRKSDGS